jgi:hypothetical protein
MRWLLLLVTLSCFGAELTGTWIGTITGNRGQMEDIAFQFVQKGSTLSGKLYGEADSTPIEKGTVAGDLVMFVLVRTEQAGNEINQTRIRFTGRFINGELELTRERESSSRSGSGAAAFVKNSPRQSFRLKRLF